MRTRMTALGLGLACILIGGGCQALLKDKVPGAKAALRLAASNQTEYAIVKPEKPTDVDEYAVSTLTNFLFQKTGAIFPVVLPGQVLPANKYIFVGLNEPARSTLGQDPLALLQDQEYVARSIGDGIFLYGKGLHGNFYAVVDFMESSLGRRWFSRLDQPVFAVTPDLAIPSFDRKAGFSFSCRWPRFPGIYDYQLGANMGFSE